MLSCEGLLANCPWALEVDGVDDIINDDGPRYSVLECSVIKGDRDTIYQHLVSRCVVRLVIEGSSFRTVEVEIAPGAIRPAPCDVEVLSMEPLERILAAESSSFAAMILPNIDHEG